MSEINPNPITSTTVLEGGHAFLSIDLASNEGIMRIFANNGTQIYEQFFQYNNGPLHFIISCPSRVGKFSVIEYDEEFMGREIIYRADGTLDDLDENHLNQDHEHRSFTA